MQIPIDQDGASEIALRSRGTPRIANRLLRRVRDYAQVRGNGEIDRPTANAALTLLEVDAHGFDEIDRKLLLAIMEKYDGRTRWPEARWPPPWPRRRTRWKKSTSRSSSRSDFWTVPRADAWRRASPTSILGSPCRGGKRDFFRERSGVSGARYLTA